MDATQSQRSRQRGVVLIFSLIVLLILTIGAVGLMRSMNNSLFSAGNLAFRRDLTNQGERAITKALTEFQTGPLGVLGATQQNQQTLNYSATALLPNAQGVPTALLNQPTFLTVGTPANDITGATSDVTIRYVIDRLCNATGPSSSANCIQSTAGPTGGTGGTGQPPPPPLPTATVYRLTVRVSGTRNTQVFLQTTFSMPDT
jgi:Tfp pilus assembly protein PilX